MSRPSHPSCRWSTRRVAAALTVVVSVAQATRESQWAVEHRIDPCRCSSSRFLVLSAPAPAPFPSLRLRRRCSSARDCSTTETTKCRLEAVPVSAAPSSPHSSRDSRPSDPSTSALVACPPPSAATNYLLQQPRPSSPASSTESRPGWASQSCCRWKARPKRGSRWEKALVGAVSGESRAEGRLIGARAKVRGAVMGESRPRGRAKVVEREVSTGTTRADQMVSVMTEERSRLEAQ